MPNRKPKKMPRRKARSSALRPIVKKIRASESKQPTHRGYFI